VITELQERKFEKIFQYIDVNSNGTLEFVDLLAYAARVMSAFEVAPTSPKGQRLVDGLQLFWEVLLSSLDIDGDRKISPEEWRGGMAAAFLDDAGGFDRALRPGIIAAAAVTDTDDDGVVSRAEFIKSGLALGVSLEEKEAAFDHMDVDGSGVLSVDEIVEAAREFFTSADPEVRGNWMFGPLGLQLAG
jgi:Ca2+-binding EF-hand superfamily protein